MKSMAKKTISPGAVHCVPADLRKVLISDAIARAKWEDITPLARNEWICWVSRNRKLEGSTLNGYTRNLRKGCAGLVASPAVLTAERFPVARHQSDLPPNSSSNSAAVGYLPLMCLFPGAPDLPESVPTTASRAPARRNRRYGVTTGYQPKRRS